MWPKDWGRQHTRRDSWLALRNGSGHPQADVLKTLYVQRMLDLGFLAGAAFYPSLAHTERIVREYEHAIDRVFGRIAMTVRKGDPKNELRGPVAHSGFRRLT